jgi:unsaturated chondroitin disaccharide hydrolase
VLIYEEMALRILSSLTQNYLAGDEDQTMAY